MDTYYTIKETSQGLYKEKGSRFIAFAFPIESSDDAKDKIQALHKTYHDARHICYAYILAPEVHTYRINDDGEPSGTAGRPIYGVLCSNNLCLVLLAVIRYFGGIKLGTSGLIHAYREAAVNAIENAHIVEKTIVCQYQVQFDYSHTNELMRVLKEKQCIISKQWYNEGCYLEFTIRKSEAKAIENLVEQIATANLKIVEN